MSCGIVGGDETTEGRPHCLQDPISNCLGHAVSTKNPGEGCGAYLQTSLQEVRKFHPDWFLEAIGIALDYVPLHVVIPQKYAVTRVVNILKSVSSKCLKQCFPPFLQIVYWDGGGIWSQGLFVSTVGINESLIQRYLRDQGKQDTGQAQREF